MTVRKLLFTLLLIYVWSFPVQAGRSEDDNFADRSVDTCRWFDWSRDGTVIQNKSLYLRTSGNSLSSTAQLISQYMLRGDLTMEVTVESGDGFDVPIPASAQMYAAFGLWVDQANYLFISISRIVDKSFIKVLRRSSEGGFENLPSIEIASTSSRLRIAQDGGQVTLAYLANGVWINAGVVSGFQDGSYVSLQATTVGVRREFAAQFSDFVFLRGATSFRSYVRSPLQSRSEFKVGGVVSDYIYHRVWGGKWRKTNPLQELRNNGMEWVRVGVTTVSDPELKATPTTQWGALPWKSSFWSSQEAVGQVLREAAARGLRLNLFLFLSDQAAHAGKQNAPLEWQGLSVDETAAKVRQYTHAVTAEYKAQGIGIQLYDVGNEIDFGILNFRPGERIAVPAGVNFVQDTNFMRNSVWAIEAKLLKAAIEGIIAADPSAKIVLHAAGLGISPADIFVKAFFKSMVDNGVPFDFAGLSLPYAVQSWRLNEYSTNCWFQRVQETVDFIASLGRPTLISEAAYPHRPQGMVGSPMKDFPFSKSGQASWVHEHLRFGYGSRNLAGFMYFYPEWYPGVAGPETQLELQSQGLFDENESKLPALSEFPESAVAQPN